MQTRGRLVKNNDLSDADWLKHRSSLKQVCRLVKTSICTKIGMQSKGRPVKNKDLLNVDWLKCRSTVK